MGAIPGNVGDHQGHTWPNMPEVGYRHVVQGFRHGRYVLYKIEPHIWPPEFLFLRIMYLLTYFLSLHQWGISETMVVYGHIASSTSLKGLCSSSMFLPPCLPVGEYIYMADQYICAVMFMVFTVNRAFV